MRISNTRIEDFPLAFLDKAEKIFLRPAHRYSWVEIIVGAPVASASGKIRRMTAVAQNTFRGFHKVDKNRPGAKEAFLGYFVDRRMVLLDDLARICSRPELEAFSVRVSEDIRHRLSNISPRQLVPYNKIRKPVDLYVEHLVAMAAELDGARNRLVPLLFLPIDSWILGHPSVFNNGELAVHGLARTSTYSHITLESTYSSMQALLVGKAAAITAKRGRSFHPIYFDLLWNHRYRNWGSNLFETNP